MRHDIETRADCERLVRAFYGRALTDPIIGFIFVDVAKLDLEAHVPRIASFWETILLGAQSYGGGGGPPPPPPRREARAARTPSGTGGSGCAGGPSSDGWHCGEPRSTSCSRATAPSWRRPTPCGWPTPSTSASSRCLRRRMPRRRRVA